MTCPFDESQNDLYNAKYQCMLDNNVVVLGYEDIKFAIDYVNKHYGNGYLKQYKKALRDMTH